MVFRFAALPFDMQLHVLMFAELDGLVATKLACKLLRRACRLTISRLDWLGRGRNREDMRLKLWRGVDRDPADYAPYVAVHHLDGPVWSVALSPDYLVSGAGRELFVLDAACSRKSNDATFRARRHATCRRLRRFWDCNCDQITLSRPILSWHLALRGSQLVVLGRLIDLSRLTGPEVRRGVLPDATPEEAECVLNSCPAVAATACPLSSSLAAWGDDGRLYLTQGRTVRTAALPVAEAGGGEDAARMLQLQGGGMDLELATHHGPSAIAAGVGPGGVPYVAVSAPRPGGLGAAQGLMLDVRVWINGEAPRKATLTGHRAAVYALATGSGRLASGADDRTIKLWDPFAPSPRLLATVDTGAKVWALALHGEILVSGGGGNAVSNVNIWCLREVPTFSRAAPGPVEREAAPRHAGPIVRLASLRGGPEQGIRSLAFDGDRVAAGADNGTVYVWQHAGLRLPSGR